jgi:hypothetical protein
MLKTLNYNIALLRLLDAQGQLHLIWTKIIESEAHILRLFQTQLHLLVAKLIDINFKLRYCISTVFEGSNFQIAWVTHIVKPFDLKLA